MWVPWQQNPLLFQVKDIYLHPEPFSSENNLLTPTFTSKRPQLRRHFAAQISAVYNNNKEPTTPGSDGKKM